MEIYRRLTSYENIGRGADLFPTGSTLYFPFFLKHNFKDIGLYTDTENPKYEVVENTFWDLNGVGKPKPCSVLNKCLVSFQETPITFYGLNNGALQVNVSNVGINSGDDCPGPLNLEWSGPDNFGPNTNQYNISSLKPGNYSLKITDGNCDITYASYYLSEPQGLSLSLSSLNSQVNDINGTCSGSATVSAGGGQPPYTYSWYANTPTNIIATNVTSINSLCAGTYGVIIVDAGNNIISTQFNITEPSAVSGVTTTKIDVTCNGGNNGEISINGIGGIISTGYTFTLTGPVPTTIKTGTLVTFSNLPQGTYNIQIKDDIGSTYNHTVIVTQPIQVTSSYNIGNITCYNGNNGSISIGPIAGGNGTYSVNITQITAVENNAVISINNGYTPDMVYSSTSLPRTGSVSLTDLEAGIYTVQINDGNNCQGPNYSLTVQQKPELNLTYTAPIKVNGFDIPCYNNNIVLPVNANYIARPYSYSTPPIETMTFYLNGTQYGASVYCNPGFGACNKNIIIGAGTHTLKVVDSTGCSSTKTITVTQPPMPLSVTYGLNIVEDSACGAVTAPSGGGAITCSCPGGCGECRQAVIDINGGVAPYSIVWSDFAPANQLTSDPHCVGYGNVVVVVTDANGCSVTKIINI